LAVKRYLIAILVLSLIVIQIGCRPQTNEPQEQPEENDNPVKGGRIIFAGVEPKTFNPILNTERDAYYFLKLIFESMVDYDKDLRIEPLLAEKWDISENGNVYTFHLRDGVKWHDGKDFTAKDVVFTLEYMKSLKNKESVYLTNIERITYFEAVDDHTVKIVFDQRFNGALDIMTFPVLPGHLYTSAQKLAEGEEEFRLMGTGPYRVKEYQPLKFLALEVNGEWWDEEPYISEFEMKFVPDESTALTSFKSDQVDLVVTTYPDWERYREGGKAEAIDFVTNKYDFIGLNFTNPVFQDKEFRKALQYGIDRNRIVEKVYLKHSVIVDVPIPPYSWLYAKGKPEYSYDPEKAKEILNNAGWMDRDNDGILEKEIDGVKTDVSFTLTVNSDNPKRLEAAKIIQENMAAMGMDVKLVELSWEEVLDRVYKKQFDAVVLGWNLANYLDLSFAFHSNQIEGGSNFVSFSSQELDGLLQEDFRAVDPEKRRETSSKVQQYIREELPYNSLYFKKAALLAKKRIRGEIEPREHNIFLNINKWYIPKDMQ
jgi:peptide/nickel transport system substrate-binding protein